MAFQIFVGLFIIIIVLFGLPYVIVWIYSKGKSTPSPKKVAFVIFLCYAFLFLGSISMAVTTPSFLQTDYSKPFSYSREILEEKDLTKARNLHELLLSTGIQDPQGFLFMDGTNTRDIVREIWVEPTEEYYLLHYKNQTFPTLLQVPTDWLNTPTTLETKFRDFLQIPQEKKGWIEVKSGVSTGHFREMVGVDIRVYDPTSDGMILIAFAYNNQTGFADFVNILYTTVDYSDHEPSPIFLEIAYVPLIQNTLGSLSFFLIPVIFVLGLVAPLSIFFVPENNLIYRLLHGKESDKENKMLGQETEKARD